MLATETETSFEAAKVKFCPLVAANIPLIKLTAVTLEDENEFVLFVIKTPLVASLMPKVALSSMIFNGFAPLRLTKEFPKLIEALEPKETPCQLPKLSSSGLLSLDKV